MIKADNGKWVTAEEGGGINGDPRRGPSRTDALVADRTDEDIQKYGSAWQAFDLIHNDDGTVSLKINQWYVTAEGGGGGPISTDRTENGPWQRFLMATVNGQSEFICFDNIHTLKIRTDLQRPVVDATGSLAGMRFRVDGSDSRPKAIPRNPLVFPTCASCPSPNSYDQKMLWTPPASPNRDFLRGDAWGHVPNPAYIPGGVLPFVPGILGSGGSSKQPQRMLTGLDYKYPRDYWPGMIRSYAEVGYDDWLRWWPNARDDGQQSINQFVDDCGYIKRTIPFVTVSLGAKPGPEGAPPLGDPRDQSVQQWQDRVGPILTALLTAKVVDVVIPAFEWDAFNIPGDVTIQTCKWIGQTAHAAGVNCAMHFYPEHGSWQADGEPRGRYGFWDDLGLDIDYLDYQGIPAWDIGDLQAHLVDWLIQFHIQGSVHKLRLREDQAETAFDEDHPNEDESAARGFLACCTRCPTDPLGTHVWGAGGGLRDQSGKML